MRQTAFKVMLGGLGAIAILGAMAAVFGGGELWQAMVTAIAGVVAAVLSMAFAPLLSRARFRVAGYGGMAVVSLLFVLLTAAVWGDVGSLDVQQELGFAFLYGVLYGPIVVAGLALIAFEKTVRMGWAWIVAGSIALLLGWFSAVDAPQSEELLVAAMSIGYGMGVLGGAWLAGITSGDHWRKHWRWGGLVLTFIGSITLIDAAWKSVIFEREDDAFKITTILFSMAGVVGYASVVGLARLIGGQKIVRLAANAVAAGLALLITLAIITENDVYAGPMGAAAIVFTCMSLALIVLAAMNRKGDASSTLVAATRFAFTCPRCNHAGDVGAGKNACATCGLKVEIRMEEPSCPGCGYLLMHNTNGVCPECGVRFAPTMDAAAEAINNSTDANHHAAGDGAAINATDPSGARDSTINSPQADSAESAER